MNVNLDPNAGFCFGVKRAIKIAEDELDKSGNLLCLGEIVHNEKEIGRLKESGLQTLQNNEIYDHPETKILFRAHGEPPLTYENAGANRMEVLDATCPVVLKLQKRVLKSYHEMQALRGQVAIVGNKSHPEIIGLNGQTKNTAIIIETIADLDQIDYGSPLRLFIQTTKDKKTLDEITELILEKYSLNGMKFPDFKYYNSICNQVSGRIPELEKFCRQHEVIIFVSGKNSSNGKQLFKICKSVNPESYFVSSKSEIDRNWLHNKQSIGISGATSTPVWQLEEIAEYISQF
ncbi:MAG: 4-hydroxy-3-methylbut-2-enyl diphosphate reductase [Bacteroidetes bacterium]|nr:4-hydroxy-3-methylbut-2-enyl diphosphate reductase [Bacteroidota bacterium]